MTGRAMLAKAEPGTSSRESCTCDFCVGCCERKPGWFKPGEAEKVAAFLGVSLEELFATKLEVEYWVNYGEDDTLLLAPAIVGKSAGVKAPWSLSHGGRCVFLTAEGRCGIHPVKPFECAVAFCGDGPVDLDASAHKAAADAWRPEQHQQQVHALLQGARSRLSSKTTTQEGEQ